MQRKKLIRRIGLAALLIVALLGGLAVIDRHSVPPAASSDAPLAANLKPIPIAPPVATPVEPEPAPAKGEPEETAGPSIDKSAERPKLLAGEPPGVTRAAPTPSAEPAPHHAPAPRPLHSEQPPQQLVWQLGVFQDIANAEKLRNKLKEAGIPNRIEARVQVGPFKNRQEAEQARKKLAAMGLNPSLLIPVKK